MMEAVLDPATAYQHILGFGASGCWWASNWRRLGIREELIAQAVDLLYHPTRGIGLNAYRHNVGAGSHGGKILPMRETVSIEAPEGGFDLSLDGDAMAVLRRVMAYPQVDCLTLFFNSPPARMTLTGEPNGNPSGETNLREDCVQAYADYVADAAQRFLQAGYPVTYVSPINEPQWDWSAGLQEGSHFTVQQALTICALTDQALMRKCPRVSLSVPESARWDHDFVYEFLDAAFNKNPFLRQIDHICCHAYNATPQERKRLRAYAEKLGRPITFHQTEWCEEEKTGVSDMERALVLGKTLHDDLTLLNVSRWEFWKAVENVPGYEWRGLAILPEQGTRIIVPKRTCVLGQYSRFVTHGVRIRCDLDGAPEDVYASAYKKGDALVCVVTNASDSAHLLRFRQRFTRCHAWRTSESLNLADIGDIPMPEGCLLPGQSVTTFYMHESFHQEGLNSFR